jgi:2-polyprenyl-3-methyl-5-hydroxy-6-metoxy-1,4-benzoquinol methylase
LEDTLERLSDQHAASFYAVPARYRARWLAARIPPGRLLEIGCGTGAQLRAFAQAGFTVEGIEALPERAHQSAHPVRLGFFETLTPEPIFDCVYHTDLLSHFADPVAALRRMQAWLRPGGTIAFEVGAQAENPARWNDNPGLHVHRWFFTADGIRTLLEAANLKTVHLTRFNLAPYVGWLRLVRAARALKRRGSGVATPAPNPRKAPGRLRGISHRIASTLRYPVGRRWPGRATATALVLARPG